MPGLAALLLTWLTSVAPNGQVLLPALQSAEVRRHFPVEAFTALTPLLWVVFHHDRDLPMAFYSPAERRDLTLWLSTARSDMQRRLPGLKIPRVFLYAPYYLEGSRLRPATEMTLDVAQFFSETLLEAFFDLRPPDGLDQRAQSHGKQLPNDQRHPAYISALAQFGSDVFAIAGELRRLLLRQHAAGRDPCIAVGIPATLFGRWERVFTTVEYRGLYDPPGPAPSALGPPLGQEDKSFLVEQAFENFWSGNVRQDFNLDCP